MTEDLAILLTLLRAGLYGVPVTLFRTLNESEWHELFVVASRQGVVALSGVGMGMLHAEQRPPKTILRQWIAQMIKKEAVSKKQQKLVQELRKIWEQNGVKCIELKGMSIGRFYWKPESRYSCDFDCFLSDFEYGNKVVEAKGVIVNREFYKNSSFRWKGLCVENHQFCTPVRGNREMKRLEKVLRGLLIDSDEYPCADFNALFLMEHAWAHFFEEALTLKQLCDWAVFRKVCGGEVDWKLFEREAKACGFLHFSESMNRLADLLDGGKKMRELQDEDKRLLADMLGQHSIRMNDGWRTRIQLVRNYFSQSWKYRVFSNHSMPYTLCRTILGFIFDREPKI